MGITVWSPLGGGKLKSSTIKRPEDDKGGRTTHGDLGGSSDEMFEKCVKVLEPIAERKGTTTTTVALRYLTLKVGVHLKTKPKKILTGTSRLLMFSRFVEVDVSIIFRVILKPSISIFQRTK